MVLLRKIFIKVNVIEDVIKPQPCIIDTNNIISIQKSPFGHTIIETKDKDVAVSEKYEDIVSILIKNNCIRIID